MAVKVLETIVVDGIEGVAVTAVKQLRDCRCCIFGDLCMYVKCTPSRRDDNRDVIFVPKEGAALARVLGKLPQYKEEKQEE